jgi:tRNA G10  N-methylase Trm11
MYIAMLGRQPAIGMAELERTFGDVTWFSDTAACVQASAFDVTRLGGTLKAGLVTGELSGDWRRASEHIVKFYSNKWGSFDGKLTVGISAYGFKVQTRDIQKTGIILKQRLRAKKVSMRLIPNVDAAHNTATSHHNKLGLAPNKVELLVTRNKSGKIIIAESVGAQNITALAARDQGRPKRDAFVGMLPPKLAQTMTNLTGLRQSPNTPRLTILDPFCGTGVILQEAALLGFNVYGTDLSDKMIDYSQQNMTWLSKTYNTSSDYKIDVGDAMDTTWQQPIDAVVCEGYLGQPFSAPPSSAKLTEVRGNCDHIISAFLKNIGSQITSGTPLCVAVPAWRATDGSFTHLPLINNLAKLGYTQIELKNIRTAELLYYREDQVVARELLVLEKI